MAKSMLLSKIQENIYRHIVDAFMVSNDDCEACMQRLLDKYNLLNQKKGNSLHAMQTKYKKANQIQTILVHKIKIIITTTAIITTNSTAKDIMVNTTSSTILSTRMSHEWSIMSEKLNLMMIRTTLWRIKRGKRPHIAIQTLRFLLKTPTQIPSPTSSPIPDFLRLLSAKSTLMMQQMKTLFHGLTQPATTCTAMYLLLALV